jgi:SAM-dependent methyltransferase
MGYYYGPEYHRAVSHAGETSPKSRWGRQLQVIETYHAGGCILDIGCSSGGFLAYLKKGPWKLYGIEASLPTAERARALTGATVFAGDVLKANFPPNSFDVITCSDVLEHLYEPRAVVQNVRSWLKPGGIFYVFVPNITSWEARTFRSYWYGLDLPRHLQHFSAKSLAGLARSVGLRQARLVTPAGCYLEQSTAMLVDDLLRKAGMRTKAMDLNAQPGLAWRIVRKGLRLTVEALYSRVAASCGAAPSLQAVFQKDTDSNSAENQSVGRRQGSATLLNESGTAANGHQEVEPTVSVSPGRNTSQNE